MYDNRQCITISGYVLPEELLQYPNSPTAHRHLVAFELYASGWFGILNFKKDVVTSQLDCVQLVDAIHSYVKGYMMEGHMVRQFPLNPEKTVKILEGYLKLRPADTLAEYLNLILTVFIRKVGDDYKDSKQELRTFAEFAHKLEPCKDVSTEKLILSSVYYRLGSKYYITGQKERAEEAFENLYDLDNSNLDAVYALASVIIYTDPERARKLLEYFLDKAPICHEKYPNAYYLMGSYYMKLKNTALMRKYYFLGEGAEEKRLPSNTSADYFSVKKTLKAVLDISNLKKTSELALD